MPRARYHKKLNTIKKQTAKMGHLAKDAIWLAVEALIEKNGNRYEAVVAKNEEIDNLEYQTESRCMRVLATQQPVGADLRVIATCLKIIRDFDRLGDLAGNIAKIARFDLAMETIRPPSDEIEKMTNVVDSMLIEVLASFENETPILINAIQDYEDEADHLFRETREEMINSINADPKIGRGAMAYAFAARYLERYADHVANIASRVHYMLTGERIKIE